MDANVAQNIFRQEFRAFFFAPFLDVARRELPPGELDTILEELGVTEKQLKDPSVWVSLEFCAAACDALNTALRDPSLFYRCGRLAFSWRYMGMLRPILRAFGSPAVAYKGMVTQLTRFNKVGRFDIESISVVGGRGRLVGIYSVLPGAPREPNRYICAARVGQVAAIPSLFDMPPAKVAHPECMSDGHEQCRYEVQWREPSNRWIMLLAFLACGLVGGAIGAYLSIGMWPSLILAGCAAGAGLGWGSAMGLAKALRDRVEEVASHQDALVQTAKENEARYAELLEAKKSVDVEVDARTLELAQTGQALAKTVSDLRATSKARDRFFANVSHDLKTPMQLILGPIDDLIAGREPPGGHAQSLTIMRRNASRQLQLIEQLLQVAQVDSGAARVELRELQVTELVNRVVDGYRTLAQAQGISLSVNADPMEPVALDVYWMESALNNLLSNALRFVSLDGHIWVSCGVRDGKLEISVKDDGQGIAAESIPHLFERFVQAGDEASRRGGVGLGLAIVHEAATLHDGTIDVSSPNAQGACFRLRIPIRHVPTLEGPGPGVSANAPFITPSRPSAGGPLPPDRDGVETVLVVEDHPEIRNFVSHVVARRFNVYSAEDGAAGLRAARRLRPSLIVSDVSMPGMTGYELCKALRSDPTLKSIPIILLTAHTGSSALVEGLQAGADDYVCKPFSGDELLARIDTQLRHRRLMLEIAHGSRLAALGTLAASLAHQIHNPLTAIVNGSELLGADQRIEGQDRAQLFEVVRDGVQRIERLTNDLLSFAREATGPKELSLEPVIQRTLRLMALQVGRAEVAFDVSPDAEGLTITTAESDVGHVLMVLLDNAFKAAGAAGKVCVALKVRDQRVQIEVLDDGPGIAKDNLERVFEPFYTTRPAGQGTGLGLALARQLSHELGGSVLAQRRKEGGTAMIFALPIGSGAIESGRAHE